MKTYKAIGAVSIQWYFLDNQHGMILSVQITMKTHCTSSIIIELFIDFY